MDYDTTTVFFNSCNSFNAFNIFRSWKSISKQEWKNTILVDINQRTQEYTGLNNNLVFNRQEFIKMYYFNSLGNELTAEQLSLVPLQRSHWPELCLLFNLDDGKNEMEKLINQTEKETMEKKIGDKTSYGLY